MSAAALCRWGQHPPELGISQHEALKASGCELWALALPSFLCPRPRQLRCFEDKQQILGDGRPFRAEAGASPAISAAGQPSGTPGGSHSCKGRALLGSQPTCSGSVTSECPYPFWWVPPWGLAVA